MVFYAFAVQAQYRFDDGSLYGFEVLARDSANPEVNSAQGVLSQLKSEDDYFDLDFQALVFAVNFLDILKALNLKIRVSVNAEIFSLRRESYTNYLNLYNVEGLVIEITERQNITCNEELIRSFSETNKGVLLSIDDFTLVSDKVEFLSRNTFFQQIKFSEPSLFRYLNQENIHHFISHCANLGIDLIIEKAKSFSVPNELCILKKLVVLQGYALHEPMYVGSIATNENVHEVIRALKSKERFHFTTVGD